MPAGRPVECMFCGSLFTRRLGLWTSLALHVNSRLSWRLSSAQTFKALFICLDAGLVAFPGNLFREALVQ